MAQLRGSKEGRSVKGRLLLWILLIPGLLWAGPLIGQQSSNAAAQQSDPLPTMRAHRVATPIVVDGRLDEAVWETAPFGTNFVQKEPFEGAPAQNDSDVWVLYDDEALYIGARLYDESPATIAANMVRRDSNYNGQFDYFEFMVDPNLDRRTGYRFRISPANVQTDRYLFDDGGEDANWDGVWTSAARITDDGWHVEMRIPLSQIRYEAQSGPQTWGINFGRRRAADNELTRFALESKLRPGRVSQFGLLEGVQIEGSPRRLEVRPYFLTRAISQPRDPINPFDDDIFNGQTGVDVRYGLGSQFTIDATFNPDFGQVEVDPAVINLSAFETFFDERRPFFVEDARIFDFNLSGGSNQLFYTRRIGRSPQGEPPEASDYADVPETVSILGAAKLTGRTEGGLSVGALAALTGRETAEAYFVETAVGGKFTAEPTTSFGVLRLQQDINDGRSNVGGIITATRRSLPSDGTFDFLPVSAYNAGIDFDHSWNDRTWGVTGFLAGSHVRGDSAALIRIQQSSNHYLQRPDLMWSSFDPSRTDLTGAEWRLQFEKRRGNWRGAIWAAQITPGFEINDLGFSRNRERLDGGARIGYQDVEPGDYLRNWSVNAFTFQNWSHEALNDTWSWDSWRGAHTAGTFNVNTDFQFNNFWQLSLSTNYSPENVSRTATRGGPRMLDPASWGGEVTVTSDNRGIVTLRPSVQFRRGQQGSGNDIEARATVTVQPSSRVQIELSPRYDGSTTGDQYVGASAALDYAPTFGTRYLFADLERHSVSMVSRLNWTFTPKLTLQLFAQPLISAGEYTTYKQLAQPGLYAFDEFEEGTAAGAACEGGRTCEDSDHRRYIDFDSDGQVDYEFTDRDFNVRSLRANAVLRWEYRPGSTVFFVWQRAQSERAPTGSFDFGRDAGALFGAPGSDTFIVKVNLWLTW